jgi:hypothetical protein
MPRPKITRVGQKKNGGDSSKDRRRQNKRKCFFSFPKKTPENTKTPKTRSPNGSRGAAKNKRKKRRGEKKN